MKGVSFAIRSRVNQSAQVFMRLYRYHALLVTGTAIGAKCVQCRCFPFSFEEYFISGV